MPPKSNHLLGEQYFDPSLFPFIYPTSDVVVPKLGEAVEDICFKKKSKQITKKNKAVVGNSSQRYRPYFRT